MLRGVQKQRGGKNVINICDWESLAPTRPESPGLSVGLERLIVVPHELALRLPERCPNCHISRPITARQLGTDDPENHVPPMASLGG